MLSKAVMTGGWCLSLLAGVACGDGASAPGTLESDPTAPAAPSPPAEEPPAIPPGATAVGLTLRRFDGRNGTVLVSSGIPLPPGLLRPDGLAGVQVRVGAEEVPVHVAALHGRHADGSLRSVLVQFEYVVPSMGVGAQLLVGAPRTAAARPAVTPPANPAAVALPTSADYLVSTLLVGPTVTVAQAQATSRSAAFTLYEQRFREFSDFHWTRTQPVSWPDNYYDRALNHWAYWVRTGNPVYWQRALTMLLAYRDQYLLPNDYAAQPHNQHIEGLALHYWLTGDAVSRDGVGRMAARNIEPFPNNATHNWGLGNRNGGVEGRIQARVLLGYVTAWELEIPGRDWRALMRGAIDNILLTQYDDGSFRGAGNCRQSLNFMTGTLHDAFIKYHTRVQADPALLEVMRRSLDFLWTQWSPARRALSYFSGECPGNGDQTPVPDLNLLSVLGFGWYYQQTGNTVYRDRGDALFEGGITQAYFEGPKQFNQQYYDSFLYLKLRTR